MFLHNFAREKLSAVENHYNGSSIVITIPVSYLKYSKFSISRDNVKVNRSYRYVTLDEALTLHETYNG
jgi:hypothetical protein